MSIAINKKLNLVIPVETDPGITIYVHSTPIGREVFETYYKVIAKAFTEIYTQGLALASGPRVAKLLIKGIAVDMGVWDGERGVKAGLIAEINRLTNVITPDGDKGWVTMPFEDALKRGVMDEDDISEVENAICFFTLASAMHRKAELRPILESVCSLWGAQLELSNSTEFKDSLPTSTLPVNTGEKVTRSSIPF